MKKIFIDNELFKLKSMKSAGLISGLKRLTQNSFEIFSTDIENIDRQLLIIFGLEDIVVKEVFDNDRSEFYSILTKGRSDKKNIVIDAKKIINFSDAVNKLLLQLRSSVVKRKTKETQIDIEIQLDGEGENIIKTGIGFFDHMLEQIARHSNINLNLRVKGDLHVDEHHTVEDTGIALGEAIKNALGDKKGIKRYGYFIPMDEAAAVCSIDLSGRNYLNFNCKFAREFVGELPTELVKEFFRGLAAGMSANIYIKANGENDHHKIEAMFKSFAKSLNEACRIDERAKGALPSTKGLL